MESRSKFKAAVRQAKSRSRTSRIILGLNGVSPDEAAPSLWNGWRQVARATALVSSAPSDDAKSAIAHAIGPDGALSSMPKTALEDLSWLEAAAGDADDPTPSSIGEERWFGAAMHLDEAIRCLGRWERKHPASNLEKTVHRIFQIVMIAAGLGVAALLAFGIKIAASAPEADEGLTATYFTHPAFDGHPFERIDHGIDLEWSDKPPLKGLKEREFSIRFEGCLVVAPDSPRALAVGANSPMNVYLDDARIIQKDRADSYELKWADNSLKPGIHKLKIEYPNCKLPGKLVLGWAQAATELLGPVPAGNLVPLGGNGQYPCPPSHSKSMSSGGKE